MRIPTTTHQCIKGPVIGHTDIINPGGCLTMRMTTQEIQIVFRCTIAYTGRFHDRVLDKPT